MSSSAVYDTAARAIRWMARAADPASWPVTVRIDLSDRCNSHCSFCAFKRKKRDIDVDLAMQLLGALPKGPSGVQSIQFSGGGEPLLHPEWPRLLRLAAWWFKVGLLTNGLAATKPEHWDRIAASCDWVRLSINAGSSIHYGKVHGIGEHRFWDAQRTLKELAARAREGNSRLRYVSMGCVVTERMTPRQMLSAASFAHEGGAHAIMFRPLWAKGKAMDFTGSAYWVEGQFEEDFAVLWPKERVRKPVTDWRKLHSCPALRLATVVTTTGEVWACDQMRGKKGYKLGSLHDASFESIWFSHQRRDLCASLPCSACVKLCCHGPLNEAILRLASDMVLSEPHTLFI